MKTGMVNTFVTNLFLVDTNLGLLNVERNDLGNFKNVLLCKSWILNFGMDVRASPV